MHWQSCDLVHGIGVGARVLHSDCLGVHCVDAHSADDFFDRVVAGSPLKLCDLFPEPGEVLAFSHLVVPRDADGLGGQRDGLGVPGVVEHSSDDFQRVVDGSSREMCDLKSEPGEVLAFSHLVDPREVVGVDGQLVYLGAHCVVADSAAGAARDDQVCLDLACAGRGFGLAEVFDSFRGLAEDFNTFSGLAEDFYSLLCDEVALHFCIDHAGDVAPKGAAIADVNAVVSPTRLSILVTGRSLQYALLSLVLVCPMKEFPLCLMLRSSAVCLKAPLLRLQVASLLRSHKAG